MEIPRNRPRKPRTSPTLATSPDSNAPSPAPSLSNPLSTVVSPYPQPPISSPRILKPSASPAIASHDQLADPSVNICQLLPDQFPLDDAHSVPQLPAAYQFPLDDHPSSDSAPQFPAVIDYISHDDGRTPSIVTAESADPAPAMIKFDPSDDESDRPRDMPAACSQTQLLYADHHQPVMCEKSLIDDDDQVLAGVSACSQLVSNDLSPSDKLETAHVEHAAVSYDPQHASYEEVAAAHDPHPAIYEEIAAAKDKLEETSVPCVEENGRVHAVADNPAASTTPLCERETHEPYCREKTNEDLIFEEDPKQKAKHTQCELTPNKEKLAGQVLEQNINTDDDKQAGIAREASCNQKAVTEDGLNDIAREASCYQNPSTEDDINHQQAEKVPEDDILESSHEEVNPQGGKEAEDRDGLIQLPLNESQLTDHKISEVDEEVPEPAPELSEAAKSNEPTQVERKQVAEPAHYQEEAPDESCCKQAEELVRESIFSSSREVVRETVEARREELTEAELVPASYNQQNSTGDDDHDHQAEDFPELNKQEPSHEAVILDGETKKAEDQDVPIQLPPNESQLSDHEISEFDKEASKPAPILLEGAQPDEVEENNESNQAEEACYEPSNLSKEARPKEAEDGMGVKRTAESADHQEEASNDSNCKQRGDLVQGSILSLSRELAPERLEDGRKELTEDELPECQPTEAGLIEVPDSQQNSTETDDHNQQGKEFPEVIKQCSHKEVIPEGGKQAEGQDSSIQQLADHYKISESNEQMLEATLETSETAHWSEIQGNNEQIQMEEQTSYETGVSRELPGEETEDGMVGTKETTEPVHFSAEESKGELALETFEACQEELSEAKLPEPRSTEAELGKAHPSPTLEVVISADEEARNQAEQKNVSNSGELEPHAEASTDEQTNEFIPSESKPFGGSPEDSVEVVRVGAQSGFLKDDERQLAVSGETTGLNSSLQSHSDDDICDKHEEEETNEVCTNASIPDAKADGEGHQKDAPLGGREICKGLLQDEKEESCQNIENEQKEDSTKDEKCPTVAIEEHQEGNYQEKVDVEDAKLLGCTVTDHTTAQPIDILQDTGLSPLADADDFCQPAPLNIEKATPHEKSIEPDSSFSLTREFEFPQEIGEACEYSLTAAKDSPVEIAETYSGPLSSSSEQGTVACEKATIDELDAADEGGSVIMDSPAPLDEAAAIDVAGSIRESTRDQTKCTDVNIEEDFGREFAPADDDASSRVHCPASRDFTEAVAIGIATHENAVSKDFISAKEVTCDVHSPDCPDDTEAAARDLTGKISDCTTNQEADGKDFIPVDADVFGTDTTSNIPETKEAAIDATVSTRESTCDDQTKIGEATAIDRAGECTCDETKSGDATTYKDAACEDSTPAEGDVFVIANRPAPLSRPQAPIDVAEHTREVPCEHTKTITHNNNGDDAVCLLAEKDASVVVDGLDSADGVETVAIDIAGSTKDSTSDQTKSSDATIHEDGSEHYVPVDEDASVIADYPIPDGTAITVPGKNKEFSSDQSKRRDPFTNEDAAGEAAIPVVEDASLMKDTPASLNGTEAASIEAPEKLGDDSRGTQIGDRQLETMQGEEKDEGNTDYTESSAPAVTADPGFISSAAIDDDDVKQDNLKEEEALPGITCTKEVSDHQIPTTAASSFVLAEAGKPSNIVNVKDIEEREAGLISNAVNQEQTATKVDGPAHTEAGGDDTIHILKTFKSGKVYPDSTAYCNDDEHKEIGMEDPPSTDPRAAVCEGPATDIVAAAAGHDQHHTSSDHGRYNPSAGSSKYGSGADRPGLLDCVPGTKFELTQLPPIQSNAKQAEAASDQPPPTPTATITAPPEPKPTSLLEKIIDKVTGKSR